MYAAQVYGLWVHSDFCLLKTVDAIPLVDRVPDVVVRIGRVGQASKEQVDNSNFFWGHLPGIGQFQITNGTDIVVQPLEDVDESILRPCILGSAMSVILQQRGFLVLHASAVVMQAGAIAFLGTSGSGKSTTASAFLKHGYSVITDDVLAIQFQEGVPLAIPSYPLIKLLPDAVTALGHGIENLPLLNRTTPKRIQTFADAHLAQTYPLRKIYLLAISDRHDIQACPPTEALLNLIHHSRANNALMDPAAKKRHFQQCSDLVQSIPVGILRRKPGLAELPLIVQGVEADLGQSKA